MLSLLCGSLGSVALLLLAGVHLYWGFGGRWWVENIVPQKNGIGILPTSGPVAITGFLVIAVLLTIAATCVAVHIEVVAPPFLLAQPLARRSVEILIAVFLLRAVGDFNFCGIFRSASETRFAHWDRCVYTPVCVTLALLLSLTF